ncbi:MAG: DnaJ family molecular chaperone [Thermoanaerobaculia bacterium]
MELPLLLAMLTAAVLLAAGALFRFERSPKERFAERPARDQIEAALLEAVASAPGGPLAPQEMIDISNWAQAYARVASLEERRALLERAAGIAVGASAIIPLAQYDALLELAFGLGFHPDALARLRARYRFDYIDHAERGRPRRADRAEGATLFRSEEPGERERLRKTLGLDDEPSPREIVAAWRRLAAENHPDRFHGRTGEERERAAARFIEVTEACERLLMLSGEGGRTGRNRT